MKLIIILILATIANIFILIGSCSLDGNNDQPKYDKPTVFFEMEGCKIYRSYDNEFHRGFYFQICKKDVTK